MAKKRHNASRIAADDYKKSTAFSRTALSVAVAVALHTGAFAQSSSDPGIEEITVVGVRRSILDSISQKRNNDVVSEVIDASDLGQLPDVSIADALGRLPGVTTVRDSGQGSQLNIRGMNGDFVQTTLNGREQASTSGYTAGSRWIAFDQYPSELITQAAVYKSPKASLIEGGVAGTVELKTANPLHAKNKHTFMSNLRYSYNDGAGDVGADDTGTRISASYQGKYLDDKLGFAIGFADLDQPNNAEEAITAGASNGYRNPRDVNGDGTADPISDQFLLRGATGSDERLGIIGTVVFEPTEALSFQLDYFRSDFDSQDVKHGFVVEGLQRDANTYSFTNGQVTDGFVTGGTATLTGTTGPWIEARNEDQSTSSLTESYGLRTEFAINERATIGLDLATSSGEKSRLDRIATMHAYEFGTGTLSDGSVVETWQEVLGQSFAYRNNPGGAPTVAFNTDYTDLSQMRLSEWEQFPHFYTDDLDSGQLDFRYELDAPVVSSFQVGYRRSDRTFADNRSTFRYGQREGQSRQVVNGAIEERNCEFNVSGVPCEPQDLTGFVSVGSFGGSLSGYPNYLILDMVGIANSVFGAGNYDAQQTWDHNWTLIESGQVKEKVDAYYFELGLNFEMFGKPVTGNIGLRHVRTDTKSVGIQQVDAGQGDIITDDNGVSRDDYKHISYGPEYTDNLPSLNLAFAISDNDILRFGAAKVMGRPPVFQLRGGAGSWIDTANDGVSPRYNVWSKGNPNLDPFRANQFDLSYEHYFENGGAATAAVFYKDIESLVENITYFEGDIPWSQIGLQAPPGLVEGQYQTAQNNDNGGYIRGLELAYTTTFDKLPGVLSGLGVNANYAYTESETTVDGGGNFAGQQLPLPGLSKNVWSVTAFWDYEGFSSYVNARYRDEYVFSGTSPGGASLQYADEYLVVDFQASYNFLNGIGLVAQVNNLTNEVNSTNFGSPWAVGEAKRFGRQYFIGLNYRTN